LVVLLLKRVLRVVTLQKHVQNYVKNVKKHLLNAANELKTERKLVAYVRIVLLVKGLKRCVKSMAAKEPALNLLLVQSVSVFHAKKLVQKGSGLVLHAQVKRVAA